MGCHTWFSRPITEKEFNLMKEYAPIEIYELTGDSKKNIENGMYDKHLYDLLMKSLKENIPCVDGKFWWQLGWGEGNPKLGIDSFTHEIQGYKNLFIDVSEYHDLFRVRNYPHKVITSRRNLRRFMRKKYFKLTSEQLEKCTEFFQKYPGGVITFG